MHKTVETGFVIFVYSYEHLMIREKTVAILMKMW